MKTIQIHYNRGTFEAFIPGEPYTGYGNTKRAAIGDLVLLLSQYNVQDYAYGGTTILKERVA